MAWREAAARWQALADLVLPFDRVRDLLADVHTTVIEGGDATVPAAELWELRRSLDTAAPVDRDALFPAIGEALEGIYEVERGAVAKMGS